MAANRTAPDPEAFLTTADLVHALDQWARRTPDVQTSVGALPKFDKHGGGHPVGLYVDDRRAPYIEMAGEVRFSLARLYSVTPKGVLLVGQIQVTATLERKDAENAKATVRLHFYVHERPGSREVGSHEELQREVVQQHEELVELAAPDAFDVAFA